VFGRLLEALAVGFLERLLLDDDRLKALGMKLVKRLSRRADKTTTKIDDLLVKILQKVLCFLGTDPEAKHVVHNFLSEV
jgi:hypothetical protein